MNTRIAKVVFCSNKHCFVNIPRCWATQADQNGVSVLELQYGDNKTAYVSLSGDGVSKATASTDVIEINGLYGNKLGINHEHEVMATILPSVPSCSKIFVEPVSVDDWEILEMHSGYIENNLLNQVRVVWPKQVLPVWINKSICIFVTVEKSEPDCKCSVLSEFTEVIIAPKTRTSPVARQQQNHVMSSSSPSHIAHSKRTNSGLSNQANPKTSRSPSRSREVIPNGHIDANEIRENDVVHKFVNYVHSWWSYLRSSSLADSSAECIVHNEFCDITTNWCLRVHQIPDLEEVFESSPLSVKGVDNSETISKLRNYLQTSNVYVNSSSLKHPASNKTMNHWTPPTSFLAVIKRKISPNERLAQIQRNMEKMKAEQRNEKIKSRSSSASTMKGKDDALNHMTGSSDESSSSRGVVVRVVVLSDTYHIDDMVARLPGGMSVMNRHVGISAELRRQAGLELTGRVVLKPLQHQHRTFSSVTFHPLFQMPDGFNKEMLHMAIKTWISHTCSLHHPLILVQGTLIKCLLKKDLYGEFLVDIESKSKKKKVPTATLR